MELSENKIEKRENPLCHRCDRVMEKSLGYYFPKHHTVRRLDIPYFVCERDRMAQLDIQALNKELELEKIKDKTKEILEIKKWFGGMHFRVQE